MYRFILFIVLNFVIINFAIGQNQQSKTDDYSRISLNVYIPEQAETISDISNSLLKDKITQLLTKNSMAGSGDAGRFILVPVINVLNKEVTATAPAMTVVDLQVSLYIGDGFEGVKFTSTSVSAKGVGQNETKAYNDAIKKININNPELSAFIETGKKRILTYYNDKCDFILKDAETAASKYEFDDAIFKLAAVPEVCKGCYMKCMDATTKIYRQKMEHDCQSILANAKSLVAQNQYEQAAQLMAPILPDLSCYKDAVKLLEEVRVYVKQKEKRDWQFKMQVYKDQVEINKMTIKAARDIGVAYGSHQPKVVYNIRGWW